MKYERFEQLPVWQDAATLAAELFTFCTHPVFRGKGDLASPIKGQKFSTAESREEEKRDISRQVFLEQIEEMAKQSRGF